MLVGAAKPFNGEDLGGERLSRGIDAFAVGDRNLGTVRGLVCFMLVAYHVVGMDPATGLRLPADSLWHHFVNSFDFIRMPAFTILSGYLYARRRMDASHLAVFWRKKARHLLVPLLFATAVTWVLRRQVYGATDRLVDALFFHYQHFWFLQAILIVFIAISCWDSLRRPGWVALVLALFGLIVVSQLVETSTFLSINGAVYLAPYFIFGILLREHRALLMRQDVINLAIGAVAIVMIAHQGALSGATHVLPRLSLAAAACGMAGTLLLLRFMPVVPIAETIGGYSYTIYLWHSISAAAVRRLAEPIGVAGTAPLFLVILIAALLLPILIHRLVRGIPIVQTLVTGEATGSASPRRREVMPPRALRRH